VLVAWCACGTQRAIRHGDKTPGTQAGSRRRAKPAPEGHGLDAAGVEGSLGAMLKGEWQERYQRPSTNVTIAPSNRVTPTYREKTTVIEPNTTLAKKGDF